MVSLVRRLSSRPQMLLVVRLGVIASTPSAKLYSLAIAKQVSVVK